MFNFSFTCSYIGCSYSQFGSFHQSYRWIFWNFTQIFPHSYFIFLSRLYFVKGALTLSTLGLAIPAFLECCARWHTTTGLSRATLILKDVTIGAIGLASLLIGTSISLRDIIGTYFDWFNFDNINNKIVFHLCNDDCCFLSRKIFWEMEGISCKQNWSDFISSNHIMIVYSICDVSLLSFILFHYSPLEIHFI